MMEKQKYDIVFVVLVYRNTDDLRDFFLHNHIRNSHTVVVNSFYDVISEGALRKIAEENNASFLSVPNKGYGTGNNRGVDYALKYFVFDYLVISNADINIREFDISIARKYDKSIIAPEILSASGRKQNPCEPFKPLRIAHDLVYKAYKGNHNKLIWIYYAWCRLLRTIYIIMNCYNRASQIYSAHGSFVIFPAGVLIKLTPLYNEKQFLMNEESHLAKKALQKDIKTIYVKDIVIDHKEDGSMSLEYKNEWPLLKQSFMEFYEYWYK